MLTSNQGQHIYKSKKYYIARYVATKGQLVILRLAHFVKLVHSRVTMPRQPKKPKRAREA